mmetsp:Transcript_27890/g.78156  ORF Transcript_27890/g.78156 Transcript_27890/m.78156 type:complete len:204 (-) Transcript_27890:292-903(-)
MKIYESSSSKAKNIRSRIATEPTPLRRHRHRHQHQHRHQHRRGRMHQSQGSHSLNGTQTSWKLIRSQRNASRLDSSRPSATSWPNESRTRRTYPAGCSTAEVKIRRHHRSTLSMKTFKSIGTRQGDLHSSTSRSSLLFCTTGTNSSTRPCREHRYRGYCNEYFGMKSYSLQCTFQLSWDHYGHWKAKIFPRFGVWSNENGRNW